MSVDEEKKSDSITENVVAVSNDAASDDFNLLIAENRQAGERSLVRKLDSRLMPTAVAIYLLNYIDRVAVTAARLQGLEADLGLSDVQYEAVLAILYVTYCPAQIPSNMVFGVNGTLLRPSLYIGGCVVAWGLTSALTGITHNYTGIMVCRVFIGLPELIAAGILSRMEGGAITMFFGFLTMWLLPDFPHNTGWLNAAERRLAQVRLAEDAGEADKDAADLTIYDGLLLAIKDPKTFIFMLISFSQLLGLSYINFFPTLTATLGFNTTITFLMAAPPWIFASVCCVLNAWHADRTGERFFHITGWMWVVIVGYIVSLSTMATGGRYFSLFLMTVGYCGFALTLTWVSNAIPRPPAKRSVAIGLVNGFGNLGNMVGSFVWKASWGPEYHQSMIIALCSLVFSTMLSVAMRMVLIKENNRMDMEEKTLMEGPGRERIEEAARLEGITFEEAVKRRKGFRYLY
ncbi:MFS general substrate transporter [Rhizopogon vinicolor AM-OR11-026]|uniref:MFS general substrate transporter n=1 Tax=Rhizopogon vinicolor AM-OR11-026 TaxID=1314800 RepID=A0A1B7NFQ2_9AGAM|nr:MFS general substrate transporter [Rhizopogon vinicolor AM-OR11-026]